DVRARARATPTLVEDDDRERARDAGRVRRGAGRGHDLEQVLGAGARDGHVAAGVHVRALADVGIDRLVHDLDEDRDTDAGRARREPDRAGDVLDLGDVARGDRQRLTATTRADRLVDLRAVTDEGPRDQVEDVDDDRARDRRVARPCAAGDRERRERRVAVDERY